MGDSARTCSTSRGSASALTPDAVCAMAELSRVPSRRLRLRAASAKSKSLLMFR
ncbi:Uncharacterised protein [Bordetella pertussis]|nr:Uncharacterised protein [Bordetella pertussis]